MNEHMFLFAASLTADANAGWLLLGVCYVAVIVQRLAELRVAARNARWAEQQGASEVGAGHYPLFVVLHVSWMVGGLAEAIWRGPSWGPHGMLALIAFAAAQPLRYWAIRSLGQRWNTRIFVFSGMPPVQTGLYRWIKHPNYLAVVIELASLPLVFGAVWTAAIASLLNAALLGFIRLPAENRALARMRAAQG